MPKKIIITDSIKNDFHELKIKDFKKKYDGVISVRVAYKIFGKKIKQSRNIDFMKEFFSFHKLSYKDYCRENHISTSDAIRLFGKKGTRAERNLVVSQIHEGATYYEAEKNFYEIKHFGYYRK